LYLYADDVDELAAPSTGSGNGAHCRD
jgi:hypothetical protein